MTTQSWLPLTDYSTKYKVSVSTLRRRIKTDSIPYRFESGKYFIVDQPTSSHQRHRPSQSMRHHSDENSNVAKNDGRVGGVDANQRLEASPASDNPSSEPVLSKDVVQEVMDHTLSELKQAYRQVLQEKEEQILHLRGEVSDLKTLVRVLENENARITGRESFYED